jgi:hypothetical protein
VLERASRASRSNIVEARRMRHAWLYLKLRAIPIDPFRTEKLPLTRVHVLEKYARMFSQRSRKLKRSATARTRSAIADVSTG